MAEKDVLVNETITASLERDGISDVPPEEERLSLSDRLEQLRERADQVASHPTFEHAKAFCMSARWSWWQVWTERDRALAEGKRLLNAYGQAMTRGREVLRKLKLDQLNENEGAKLACYMDSCRARHRFGRILLEEGDVKAAEAMLDFHKSNPQTAAASQPVAI